MPGYVIVIIVVVFVMMDTIIIGSVITAATAPLRDFAERHPFKPPTSPQVRREFCSIKFGIMNLGKCIHLTVDRACLHMEPAMLLRMFGAQACSIPREKISVPDGPATGLFEKGMEATLAGERVWLPEWCVKAVRERSAEA